ncbi:MAG: polyprenyl synthetase family protein [Saprospiraceae bacterium]|nr:polyprenyl synthetase family protein [Saprospiraceae bacterium]
MSRFCIIYHQPSMFQQYFTTLETYFKDLDLGGTPATLYDPINYHLSLGGKRIRPLLCMLSYELFKSDYVQVLPQAAAIEMFHNFTLVHDDIMDEAPERRGATTLYRKFGLNAGILGGDAMLILTYQLLAEHISPDLLTKCLDVFNEAALAICEGQQYDMDFESRIDVTLDEYLQMIQFKTAVLLGASMAIGGMKASVDNDTSHLLWNCGEAMGMAFQMQDDLLDVFGQSAKTGKQQGGDIIQGKKTILLVKALELSNDRQKSELRSLIGNSELGESEKVRAVTEIYQSLEVESHCNGLKQHFLNQGFAALDAIDVPESGKDKLRALFSSMIHRDS